MDEVEAVWHLRAKELTHVPGCRKRSIGTAEDSVAHFEMLDLGPHSLDLERWCQIHEAFGHRQRLFGKHSLFHNSHIRVRDPPDL